MRLTVSRTDLLQDAIAIVLFKFGQYHHDREMTVRFEGAQAVDGGGKRRKFSLLLKTMASPTAKVRLFVSRKGRYLPMHNKDALQEVFSKCAASGLSATGAEGFLVYCKEKGVFKWRSSICILVHKGEVKHIPGYQARPHVSKGFGATF